MNLFLIFSCLHYSYSAYLALLWHSALVSLVSGPSSLPPRQGFDGN